IGRLFSSEDAIDVLGRVAILIDKIGSIGHQCAARRKVTGWIHGGEFVPCRKSNNQVAMNESSRARGYHQSTTASAHKDGDSSLNFGWVMRVDRNHFHAKRWCDGLDDGELPNSGG